MRMRTVLAVGLVAITAALTLVAGTTQPSAEARGRGGARAVMHDVDGQRIGHVVFRGHPSGVVVRVFARDLAPGFHGFHIHMTGLCEPATGFTTAGGHWNPGMVAHGEHAGDLIPLFVTGDGRARLRFVTDRFAVGDLFDGDRNAVIIHEGRDNLANIPERYFSTVYGVFGPDQDTLATGDAGSRVACGVIRRPRR